MTIYFASLRLCVKLGSQSREDAKIRKDYICEKHSTTNLFCEMVLVTDSHINEYSNENRLLNIFFIFLNCIFSYENPETISPSSFITRNILPKSIA